MREEDKFEDSIWIFFQYRKIMSALYKVMDQKVSGEYNKKFMRAKKQIFKAS